MSKHLPRRKQARATRRRPPAPTRRPTLLHRCREWRDTWGWAAAAAALVWLGLFVSFGGFDSFGSRHSATAAVIAAAGLAVSAVYVIDPKPRLRNALLLLTGCGSGILLWWLHDPRPVIFVRYVLTATLLTYAATWLVKALIWLDGGWAESKGKHKPPRR